MKLKQVIFIDSKSKAVIITYISNLEEMQKLVGGLIERVAILENGDELFANEEALFMDFRHGFEINNSIVLGNAFVIGAADENGNSTSAFSNVDEIEKLITFHDIPKGAFHG